MLMILVLPPRASGELLYDPPFPFYERSWGAHKEAGSPDSPIEYALFQLFFGPFGPVLTA